MIVLLNARDDCDALFPGALHEGQKDTVMSKFFARSCTMQKGTTGVSFWNICSARWHRFCGRREFFHPERVAVFIRLRASW